jgi:DNA-binding protein H-NS
MAKSLAQIQNQIAKLEQQAQALKAKEAKGVIARIKEAIAHYDLSAEDLGLTTARGKPGRPAGAAPAKAARKSGKAAGPKKTVGVIKFRDEAGNEWTGRGKRPNWYKAALAAGKTSESLLVKA